MLSDSKYWSLLVTLSFQNKNGNKFRILPFQHGMLIAISALKSLYNELRTKYGIGQILTEWITQESFTISYLLHRISKYVHTHQSVGWMTLIRFCINETLKALTIFFHI